MKTLDEKEVLVDTYRKWERSHNRENYGRYDAFKCGYDKGAKDFKERVIETCKKRLKMYEPSRMYWNHHTVGRVAECEEILEVLKSLPLHQDSSEGK